jgi:hypothetical protein
VPGKRPRLLGGDDEVLAAAPADVVEERAR